MGQDAAQGIGEATALLQGTGKEQLKNNELNDEAASSGVAYVKDASGKAIDFMRGEQQRAALAQQQQIAQQGQMARTRMQVQAKQQEAQSKIDADKAKADYQNFFTMTPELAGGLYESSGGKLDFRKSVGQRLQTKVVIPLAQIFGREMTAKMQKDAKEKGGKESTKDLNALKAFTKQYETVQKQYSGMELQMKQSLAKRNPKIKEQLDENVKYLQQHKSEYENAVKKMGEMGGVEPGKEETSSNPPMTSKSDEDSLIDKAFGG